MSEVEVKQTPAASETIEPRPPPMFLRLRSVALGLITFLAFLWIILICIVIYAQWDLLDHVQRSLILIMLFINTVTVIMLPILLLRPFRPWLDAARVLLLILIHGGIALFFAIRSPSFTCISSASNLNEEAVCTTITVFVNVFDWAIPVLVVLYASGLAFLVRKQSKLRAEPSPVVDAEKQVRKAHNSLQSQGSLSSTYEAKAYAHAI